MVLGKNQGTLNAVANLLRLAWRHSLVEPKAMLKISSLMRPHGVHIGDGNIADVDLRIIFDDPCSLREQPIS